MEKRLYILDCVEGEIVEISTNSALGGVYQKLFQNAKRCAKRHPLDVEHGVKIIIFGCFWLEAKFNSIFSIVLENEIKNENFSKKIWSTLKRSSIFEKIDILSPLFTEKQKNRINELHPDIKNVFEIRNRLAHFKDSPIKQLDNSERNEAIEWLASLPVPDLNKKLMWEEMKTYSKIISDTNIWLNNFIQLYCTKNDLGVVKFF